MNMQITQGALLIVSEPSVREYVPLTLCGCVQRTAKSTGAERYFDESIMCYYQ